MCAQVAGEIDTNIGGDYKASDAGQALVGIIGAGIAGLVTAKIFLRKGFEVVVFEKEPALGGVWTASRTYPGLRANNSKQTYGFSDYPYPDSVAAYPEADEIRNYLESYADHFAIRSHIRFNCEVTNLVEAGEDTSPGFQVTVRSTDDVDSFETLHLPYVVICNGPFSAANLPDFPGQDSYGGRIRHSSECTDPKVADAERVIVIGGGKSALDCAAWAAREGKTSTLVFRKAHWMAPRYLPGGVQSMQFLITRFTELFIDYPTRPLFEKFLHGPGKPIVNLWWSIQNWGIPRASKMPPLLIPDSPLPAGFESIGQVDDFYELLNAGRITANRARIAKFNETGVELDDGAQVDADLVIFATGWKRDLSFLDESLQKQIYRSGRVFILPRNHTPHQPPRCVFLLLPPHPCTRCY
jgi:dimethylaniline monooxygenase (N-oxide forming)